MKIMEKTFVQWWGNLTPSEKDEAMIRLASKCNVSLHTVKSWGLGYRKPRSRNLKIINSYFTDSGYMVKSQTLFPE